MRNTLAEDGSVATLEGNGDSVSEKLLNDQRGGTGKLSVVDARGDTTEKLPKAIAHGASGLENQRDEGGRFNSGQLVILLPLLVLALLRSPSKRAESSPRGQGRWRGGMSDRDIQHEPSPAEAEAKIRSSSILSGPRPASRRKETSSCRIRAWRDVTDRRRRCLQTIKWRWPWPGEAGGEAEQQAGNRRRKGAARAEKVWR